jgi:hypothetical protein
MYGSHGIIFFPQLAIFKFGKKKHRVHLHLFLPGLYLSIAMIHPLNAMDRAIAACTTAVPPNNNDN